MIGRAQLSEIEEHLENPEAFEAPAADGGAEREIRRIVDEIDNLCDRGDWRTLRSLLADEVDADFSSLTGGKAGPVGADDLIGELRGNLFGRGKTFHQRTNHRIETADTEARAFSKCHAIYLTGESGSEPREVWAHYTHRLDRDGEGWRVVGISVEVIYERGGK